MADRQIKTTLKLDGEKQYRDAIRQANSTLKTLRSELKAETAEMGRNASAQDKAAKKADSLRKQIAEQEKIVKALQEALEQAKTQYADNTELQEKWQQKLNNARTVLANMKNDLSAANDSMKTFNSTASDVDSNTGAAVQGVVDLGDAFDALRSAAGTLASSIGNAFQGMLENIEAAVSGSWDLVSQAMAAASEWNGLQQMYGGDTADIAKFMKTAAFAGADTGTVTSAINKLIQATHNGDKDIVKLTKEWGVEEDNYRSHWDYFAAVWKEMYANSDGGKNQKALWQYAETLFGSRNASGITGLVNDWTRGVEEYDRNISETGLEWTQEQITAMNSANDQIREITELWAAFRENAGVTLWYTVNGQEGADKVLELLRDVSKLFFGDGDKSDVTKKITLDVQGIIDWAFTGIGNISTWLKDLEKSFNESDDPVMKSIGGIIGSVSSLLDWFVANKDKIVQALEWFIKFKIEDLKVELTTGQGIMDWAKSIGSTLIDIGKWVFAISLWKNAGTAAQAGATALNALSWAGISGSITTIASNLATIASPIAAIAAYFAGTHTILSALDDAVDKAYENQYGVTMAQVQDGLEGVKVSGDEQFAAVREWIALMNELRHMEGDIYGTEQMRRISELQDKWIDREDGSNLMWRYQEYVRQNAPGEFEDLPSIEALLEEQGYEVPTLTEAVQELTDAIIDWKPEDEVELVDDYVPTWEDLVTAPLAAPTDLDDEIGRSLDRFDARAGAYFAAQTGAIADALRGATVTMDGTTVGYLVLPTINRALGDKLAGALV